MPFFVYILQSESTGKFYVGQTSDVEARITRHNDEVAGPGRYTRKQKGPWRLAYVEEYPSRGEAMKRERQIKNWKSRKAIQNLINTSVPVTAFLKQV